MPITCPACTAIGLIVRGQERAAVQSAREAERVARPTSLRFDATRQSSVNRGKGGQCAPSPPSVYGCYVRRSRASDPGNHGGGFDDTEIEIVGLMRLPGRCVREAG